jgi:DNA-binding transcriptional LysR family regulator
MDWDGVRVFLAIAREGSMRAAGRARGLSSIRLAEMEADLGGQPLFDRLPAAVRLNAAGERLLAVAEDAEQAMPTLERRRRSALMCGSRLSSAPAGFWLAACPDRRGRDSRRVSP